MTWQAMCGNGVMTGGAAPTRKNRSRTPPDQKQANIVVSVVAHGSTPVTCAAPPIAPRSNPLTAAVTTTGFALPEPPEFYVAFSIKERNHL